MDVSRLLGYGIETYHYEIMGFGQGPGMVKALLAVQRSVFLIEQSCLKHSFRPHYGPAFYCLSKFLQARGNGPSCVYLNDDHQDKD